MVRLPSRQGDQCDRFRRLISALLRVLDEIWPWGERLGRGASAAFRPMHDDLRSGCAYAPPPASAALVQEHFKNWKLIRRHGATLPNPCARDTQQRQKTWANLQGSCPGSSQSGVLQYSSCNFFRKNYLKPKMLRCKRRTGVIGTSLPSLVRICVTAIPVAIH